MSFIETVENIPYRYELPKILYGMVRAMRPDNVVEIGTHIGYTACWLAKAIQENNKGRLFCIDPFCWVNEKQKEQWEQNLTNCGVRDWVTLIEGRSEEVSWPDKVDFAFVDGNHTYPVCKWDTEKCKELGAKIIAIHDSVAWDGSRIYCEEIRQSKDWQDWDFIEFEFDCGILIAKKREPKPDSWGSDIGEQWDKPTVKN